MIYKYFASLFAFISWNSIMNLLNIFNLNYFSFILLNILIYIIFLRICKIAEEINLNYKWSSWFTWIFLAYLQNCFNNLFLFYNWDFITNLICWGLSITIKIIVNFIIFIWSNWFIRFIHVGNFFFIYFLFFSFFSILFYFFWIVYLENLFWSIVFLYLWKIVSYISYLYIKSL